MGTRRSAIISTLSRPGSTASPYLYPFPTCMLSPSPEHGPQTTGRRLHGTIRCSDHGRTRRSASRRSTSARSWSTSSSADAHAPIARRSAARARNSESFSRSAASSRGRVMTTGARPRANVTADSVRARRGPRAINRRRPTGGSRRSGGRSPHGSHTPCGSPSHDSSTFRSSGASSSGQPAPAVRALGVGGSAGALRPPKLRRSS